MLVAHPNRWRELGQLVPRDLLTGDEDIQREATLLGSPLAAGFLFVRTGGTTAVNLRHGKVVEVAVWAPPAEAFEPHTWRGWLFIEGHPEYDPPRRILGATPFQPIHIAFTVIEAYASAHQAHFVLEDEVGP